MQKIWREGQSAVLWIGLLLLAVLLIHWLLPDLSGEDLLFMIALLGVAEVLARLMLQSRALRADLAAQQNTLAEAQQVLTQTAARQGEQQRRVNSLLHLYRHLNTAQTEDQLMDAAMTAIQEFVGALGCSFLPVDRWGQPLPARMQGRLPGVLLEQWQENLRHTGMRDRCGDCTILQSTPGKCPLHPAILGDSLTVFCLPLEEPQGVSLSGREGRRLGILHLYMPPQQVLKEDDRRSLAELLPEISRAVQSLRARQQEMILLEQMRQGHTSESWLSETMTGLLEDMRQVFGARTALVRLRPFLDERLPGLTVQSGQPIPLTEPELQQMFLRLLDDVSDGGILYDQTNLVAPLQRSPGPMLGMFFLEGCPNLHLNAREHTLLRTFSAQLALLVENERLFRWLEYKAIIQERTRLAREIHDGLAQTLALLKLQSAQIQSALAKNDLARVMQLLKENNEALSEAYLDTRQSIDNLRLTPGRSLESWLEQSIQDFESGAHVAVNRRILPLPTAWVNALSPEIQAQLVRIVQEALNNVRKHSQACAAWVSLNERQSGDLVLEIGDDGRGFNAEDVPPLSRHGLKGMRERAELLGAEFQIISQAQQGTVVRLTLPAYIKDTK